MPRKARIDAPGALHHIIFRGIEGNAIFKDLLDYRNFLERLGTILEETDTPCFAWALLTNHVHLLLRTGLRPISTIMRRLLTGYAQQFNRRHKRSGHLFQNRYKSFLCEEDVYFQELVRYIHLNPIRASMVKDLKALNTHPNSGHAVLMGKIKHDWQDTDSVLYLFDDTIRKARSAYLSFVAKGVDQGRRPELVGGGLLRSHGGWTALKALQSAGIWVMGDERILGSSDFVETVLRRAEEQYEKRTLAQAHGMDLEQLIIAVADHMEIDPILICSSSRQRAVAKARAIICWVAADRLNISGAEVARKLELSPSAVSKLVSRGRNENLASEVVDRILDYRSI
ncbi:MAG: transposase [Desulfobacterales bacterium]|nr:transposase [Desulfobacterales bacterium]